MAWKGGSLCHGPRWTPRPGNVMEYQKPDMIFHDVGFLKKLRHPQPLLWQCSQSGTCSKITEESKLSKHAYIIGVYRIPYII